jgi:hypothetical protein
VTPTQTLDVMLECAQAAGSDFVVSEDKDLLRDLEAYRL